MRHWRVGLLLVVECASSALAGPLPSEFEVILRSSSEFQKILTKQDDGAKGWIVPLFRVFDERGQLQHEQAGKVNAPVTFTGPITLARGLSKELALLGKSQPSAQGHTLIVYELEKKLCPPCDEIISASLPELRSAYRHPINIVRVKLVEKSQ